MFDKKISDSVFYGILDAGYVDKASMFEKCKALIAGGSGIIQLRAKNLSHARRKEIAQEISPLFDAENSPVFIINDDIELAAIIPNAGLHIGQDDISPQEARRILGVNKVIGLSTHSLEQASAADALHEAINYFAVGPVYATNTKPGRIPVGLELVRGVAQMKPRLPWFAIGGVNLKTVGDVAKAGAPRIVAVSDVLSAQNTEIAVKTLTNKFLLSK